MIPVSRQWSFLLLPALLLSFYAPIFPQDMGKVQSQTLKIADGIYMLRGEGGNIGVCAGADGILLIDCDLPELHEKIAAALAAINPGPVRFLLNTNWHFDHAKGNELFAKAGATIIAHENARQRMTVEQTHDDFGYRIPPYPAAALPVITVADSMTLYFNVEEIDVLHIPGAHSDADLLFHFRKANVTHAGDLVFSGIYPYIDVDHGGSVDGTIAAAEKILRMMDTNTVLIPGHGRRVMKKADVSRYRDMLVEVRGRVSALISQGKNEQEVVAQRPTADIDKDWDGPGSAELFVRIVYRSLTRK